MIHVPYVITLHHKCKQVQSHAPQGTRVHTPSHNHTITPSHHTRVHPIIPYTPPPSLEKQKSISEREIRVPPPLKVHVTYNRPIPVTLSRHTCRVDNHSLTPHTHKQSHTGLISSLTTIAHFSGIVWGHFLNGCEQTSYDLMQTQTHV